MGVDTKVRLKGHVKNQDILEFIRNTYDKDAYVSNWRVDNFDEIPSIKERYDDSGRWLTEVCFIVFKHPKDGLREMFYMHSNVNFHENLEYYEQFNLTDMVKSEVTYLSLGHWASSVDILKTIAAHFGGWLDENDCDDNPYYWVDKIE
jgi:hypothetical protein